MGFVIAVDGPAAAGKGTLARGLARAYDFAYLDSGRLYREVARLVLAAGPRRDEEAAVEQALQVGVDAQGGRGEEISRVASQVARYGRVREQINRLQRAFSQEHRGVVVDGRDIGTVVFPDARVKIFMVADEMVRGGAQGATVGRRGAFSAGCSRQAGCLLERWLPCAVLKMPTC